MENIEPIINRVANSDLITIYLAETLPQFIVKAIDIAEWMNGEFIIREADFRSRIKQHDWNQYNQVYLSVYSSNDAIIPDWAFMLISVAAAPYAKKVMQLEPAQAEMIALEDVLSQMDISICTDKKILIKGCGTKVPRYAVVRLAQMLQPIAHSVMYGEACSNVPLFKKSNHA